jgi:molybdopterin-guanine dinucleotide biosynthesis protein A
LLNRLCRAPSYVANQPVIGLWPVDALQRLDEILASEARHSMLYFIEQIGARAVTLDNPPANINTVADLERLEQLP